MRTAQHCDAPTLAQRTPLACLAGGGMAVLGSSLDDIRGTGCRAAQMGFSLTLSTFQIYAKKTR